MTVFRRAACLIALLLPLAPCRADESAPAPVFVPQWLGAQYTFIDQHQFPVRSPYVGPLTLSPGADTERTHTFGAYFGVQLPFALQFYFDLEKFDGEGVSGATGMGGLTNGDVVRSGAVSLAKRVYVARRFLRYQVPLGEAHHTATSGQGQLPGNEADRRLEFKLGKMAVTDDFDKNRYNNSARTQFLNWSLWDDSAWDYAADTRGYTNGFVAGYVAPAWTLHYGVYQMPRMANGQTLEWPLTRARGENLELTLDPQPERWILRLLVFRNVARMGIYREALALAAEQGTTPDIRADDRDGRHKSGFGVNAEIPLADDGDTGLFARYGHNDGRTESFALTEVDRNRQIGVQGSGARSPRLFGGRRHRLRRRRRSPELRHGTHRRDLLQRASDRTRRDRTRPAGHPEPGLQPRSRHGTFRGCAPARRVLSGVQSVRRRRHSATRKPHTVSSRRVPSSHQPSRW
jgi:high affinity Mn2+ porin